MAHLARTFLTITVLLLAIGVPAARADDTNLRATIIRVDSTPSPARDIYVSVSDPFGRPITGLGTSDFSVAEDGSAVSVDSTSAVIEGQVPIAFALVMDVSGSMADQGKLDAAKLAASGLVG